MPSLRTDKGNKWMARAMVHGKQIACKLFPAGEKYGQAWLQAKAWEESQKAIALKTFEDEQRELELKKFQNEQKAFMLKAWKAGQEAIARKILEEEQKATDLQKAHEEQVNAYVEQKREKQKMLDQKALEEEQEVLALKQIEGEQVFLEQTQNAVTPKKAISEATLKILAEVPSEVLREASKETPPVAQQEVVGKKRIRVQSASAFSKGRSEERTQEKVGRCERTIEQQDDNQSTKSSMLPSKGVLARWGEKYLVHVKRTMSPKTHVEKQAVMRSLYAFCEDDSIRTINEITPAKAYEFLADVNDEKGGNVANKYRKNLMAAWNWAEDFVDGFPKINCPFAKVKPFATEQNDRYVPPEEDVIKVLQQASGQDLIFLLTFYYTGARRGEIFKLRWQDVNLAEGKIRLSDNKAGNGQQRVRWLQMHPELVRALTWWQKERPCTVENVFMQTHCNAQLGKPFTQRSRFMENLCQRAGVKPFGFHAIRHKCAAITFCMNKKHKKRAF